MARQVLPIVGAVIGAYFGQAQLGYMIGSFVGNAVDPLVIQRQGPRLDDLKVTTSAYGNPIPYIKGHPRVGGTIVWNSDRREIATTTSEQQGKGGPVTETTTYTYEIDLLIVLSINQLAAVRRIWSNGKLAWTRAADADLSSVAAGGAFARRVTFYSGNDTQMPDPTYEAAVGVGNAPAYRARSTIFIEGLQLGGGGNLPNLTFEVAEQATITAAAAQFATLPTGTLSYFGAVAFSEQGFILHAPNADASINIYWIDADGSATLLSSVKSPSANHGGGGQTDVSCILQVALGVSGLYHLHYGDASDFGQSGNYSGGGRVDIDLPEDLGGSHARFGKRTNRLVMGSASIGSKRLYLVDFGGRGLVATSVPMASYVNSVCVGSGQVYASSISGSAIYVLSDQDLTLLNTLSTPFTDAWGCALTDAGGTLYWATSGTDNGGNLYRWTGSAWVIELAGLGVAAPSNNYAGASIDYRDGVFWVAERAPVRFARRAVTALDIGLGEVVTDLCTRTGLQSTDVDVAGLTGNVRSLAVASVTSARQVLDLLGRAHFFQSVETGGKIKFVKRGGAPVATLTYEQLGASEADSAAEGDPLPLQRANDDEIPATVTVRFANIDNDYQEGAESSFRLTQGNGDQVLEVALGLTPTEAKRISDATVTDYGISVNGLGPVKLDRSASAYEPTDVLLLTDHDGSVFRARVEKIDDAGGVRTLQLVLDDATVINSSATTAGGYQGSSTITLPSASRLELMDIPILRDADDGPGFYLAMKGGTAWPGGAYYKSSDDSDYERLGTVTERAVFGRATTVLGSWSGGNVFDETNSVTVDVDDGQLSSVTRDQLLARDINALLVGGEVIQFQTATLVSAGVYKLTSLLRGRRGTEWTTSGHVANERVVLLQMRGMRRVAMQLSELNLQRYYKGVSFGRSLASALAKQFTNTGIGLKPFSPTDLRAQRAASGGVTLSWKRRSRLSMPTSGVVVPPLGEETEAYQVEIYSDAGFTTLRRTLAATSSSVTYALADIVADFGVVPSVLRVRVFQISASVGRGYALQAAVDVPLVLGSGGAFQGGTQFNLVPLLVVNGRFLAWASGVFPGEATSVRVFESADGLAFSPVSLNAPALTGNQWAAAVKASVYVSFPSDARNGNPTTWAIARGIQGAAPISIGSQFLPAAWAVTTAASNTVFAAIAEGNKVYTSSDGQAWALAGTMSGTLPAILSNGTNGIGANTSGVQLYGFGTRWVTRWGDKILYSDTGNAVASWVQAVDLTAAPYSLTSAQVMGIVQAGSALIALVRGNTGGNLRVQVLKSTDNGATWSSVYSVDSSSPPPGVNLSYVTAIAALGSEVAVFCVGTFALTLKSTGGTTNFAWQTNNLINVDGYPLASGATVIVRDLSRDRGDGVLEHQLKSSADGITFTACTGI